MNKVIIHYLPAPPKLFGVSCPDNDVLIETWSKRLAPMVMFSTPLALRIEVHEGQRLRTIIQCTMIICYTWDCGVADLPAWRAQTKFVIPEDL